MSATEIYQEFILDYWKNPKNFGKIENPTISFKDVNPSCGDVVQIDANIENGKIKDIKFFGSGCAISQAAASMLTEHLKGKNINEVKNLNKENILEMLDIELSAMRIKCALLCLKVFKCGLYLYLGEDYAAKNN